MNILRTTIGCAAATVTLVAVCHAEQSRMNINAVACKSKDATMQANKWLSEGDSIATAREVMNGNCQMLEKGTPIFIEKHGIEWAKVRVRGSNTMVWTLEKFTR